MWGCGYSGTWDTSVRWDSRAWDVGTGLLSSSLEEDPGNKVEKSLATGLLTNSPAYITFHLTAENCILQIQRKNQVMFFYHVLQSLCPTSLSPCAYSHTTSPSPGVQTSPSPQVPRPTNLNLCILKMRGVIHNGQGAGVLLKAGPRPTACSPRHTSRPAARRPSGPVAQWPAAHSPRHTSRLLAWWLASQFTSCGPV